jgi:thiamine-phosphate pyrophosphorylase
VAVAEHADGVPLGENSLPVEEAKRLLQFASSTRVTPEEFLTGVSCHSLESAQRAESCGADYIFFGPIFATPSKERFGPPQGTQRLREVCRAVSLPVLAIGGITPENAASCTVAGAAGIAAIRLFQAVVDLVGTVERLR